VRDAGHCAEALGAERRGCFDQGLGRASSVDRFDLDACKGGTLASHLDHDESTGPASRWKLPYLVVSRLLVRLAGAFPPILEHDHCEQCPQVSPQTLDDTRAKAGGSRWSRRVAPAPQVRFPDSHRQPGAPLHPSSRPMRMATTRRSISSDGAGPREPQFISGLVSCNMC
jgi:hypothetical protein